MPRAHSERGQILPLVALGATALILFLALVIDGGFAFERRREAQNAADFAALAGTRVVTLSITNPALTSADVYNAISSSAAANGATVPGLGTASGALWVDSNGATLATPNDYVTDTATAIPSGARGVKVPAARTWRPFLLGLINSGNWTAGANAVARTTVGAQPICAFCVIGPTPTFTMKSGSTKLTVHGGAIGTNSGLDCSANANIASDGTGSGLNVYGSYSPGNCTVPSQRTMLASPIPDPLGFLPDPTASGTNYGAVTDKGPNTTENLDPGIYSSLSIQANATVHLNPGTYYFSGDIQVESSSWLTGANVTLVFMGNANFKPKSGTANVQLSAPAPTDTTATYPGLLMYFDRRGTHTIQTQASSTSWLQGTIYGAPNPADPIHTGTFLDMESNASVAAMNGMVIVGSAALNSGSDMTVTYDSSQNVQLPGGPPALVE